MRRSTRAIARALELAGIEGARGPDVSDNIQLTYLLSDLSPLMPPLGIIRFYMFEIRPQVPAVFSGIDIRPPPDSAIEIFFLRNNSAIDAHWILGDALDANLAAIVPDFWDPAGVVSRCVMRDGTRTAAVLGFTLAAGATEQEILYPIIVQPGNSFCMTGIVANTLINFDVCWREVPAPPTVL